MSEAITLIDNSTLKEVRRCFLAAYFRYERHWTPEKRPIYFSTGTCWHGCLDVVWSGYFNLGIRDKTKLAQMGYLRFVEIWQEEGLPWPLDPAQEKQYAPRTPGIAGEMLYPYINTWWEKWENMELVSVERPFAVPIDPNDPNLFYVGRLDKIYKEISTGHYWVGEHKTTTSYSKDFGIQPRLRESYSPDGQVDGYSHALHMIHGGDAKGVMMDVSLYHRTHHNIHRQWPVFRSTTNLEAWRKTTLWWVERWREARATGYFPLNTDGCVNQFGKECAYLGTCRKYGEASPKITLPNGFVEEIWEPYKLDELREVGAI